VAARNERSSGDAYLDRMLAPPRGFNAILLSVDLWWGLFMITFGCVVLGMSHASPHRCAGRDG
jgi:hypothetical protein